jgi:hypothetical protein
MVVGAISVSTRTSCCRRTISCRSARCQGSGAATFAIDGLGANDLGGPDFRTGPPNFDAVAEVKVLINSYQAENGRSAGAVINVVTKSGTKHYRGSGYWYKRHEMWNATPFFNNALDLEKPR